MQQWCEWLCYGMYKELADSVHETKPNTRRAPPPPRLLFTGSCWRACQSDKVQTNVMMEPSDVFVLVLKSCWTEPHISVPSVSRGKLWRSRALAVVTNPQLRPSGVDVSTTDKGATEDIFACFRWHLHLVSLRITNGCRNAQEAATRSPFVCLRSA